MSLFIEVYVGSRTRRRLVAQSHAYNISDLAATSNYEFESDEFGAPHLDIPPNSKRGDIKGHARKQSVWALVEKIARNSID